MFFFFKHIRESLSLRKHYEKIHHFAVTLRNTGQGVCVCEWYVRGVCVSERLSRLSEHL